MPLLSSHRPSVLPLAAHGESYVNRLQDTLTSLYIDDVIWPDDPELADLLYHKYGLLAAQPDRQKRIADYIAFWEGLPPERQRRLAEEEAKINHLARRARIFGTTDIVWAHNEIESTTAGAIDYVLRRFRAENVSAAQVQKFLDENAVAWFSLTGHPTNPTTVAYTIAETDMMRVISRPDATRADLIEALRVLYRTPIIGPRKTPLEETEETLNTLDVIYDAALPHRALFADALQTYGYAREGVEIRTPLIRPCAWTLGDADGNPSQTAEVLEDGIALHRRRIKARYLQTAEPALARLPALRSVIENAASALSLRAALRALRDDATEPALRAVLADLEYLVSCFGLGFGVIDLRHNAEDIMIAMARLAGHYGLYDEDSFAQLSLQEQEILISGWLQDEGLAATAHAMDADSLIRHSAHEDDENGRTTATIISRLQVIGRHPDMCDKLIIAETTHAAQALAALFLLRASGNVIGPGSTIDLTVLSESVADLVGISTTLEDLLNNDLYRAHVVARGRLLAMIAKSDTTRQDGRGEAEYAQYEAAVDIFRVIDKMKHKYPELEGLQTSIKNGGGQALQRGGGRVTEIPAIHGRAAADARATDIGPSTLTIQGHQQSILFSPGRTALGTLEALAAQNLYSKAGVHGEMPPPEAAADTNKQYARMDTWLFAKTAGLAFETLAKKNPAIDELLVKAPWLSMKAGNASSRPAKRGEAAIDPGITLRAARGENPKALMGRAISGERLTTHAHVPVFAVLGLAEAMEAVRLQGASRLNIDKYGNALHHLYRAHKIHRDGARATINAVAMADFDLAWPLLAERPRPARKDVQILAARFLDSEKPHENPPEITLAFLEEYFLTTEKLAFEMVTGQPPDKDFAVGDGLRLLWPELAAQVDYRGRLSEFARVIETHRTVRLNHTPDEAVAENEFRITQALYAAASVINAPVGILATRTRLEPAGHPMLWHGKKRMQPGSFTEKKVARRLKMPQALTT